MAPERDDPTDVTEIRPASGSVLQLHPDQVDDAQTGQAEREPSPVATHPSGEPSRADEEYPTGWKPTRETPAESTGEATEEVLTPQYAPLLAALEESLRQIILTAEADAEEIRQSAEQYRAAVVSAAHRASEAIRAAAERERDSTLEAASGEIIHWLDEFEQECRRWVTRSRQSAAESGPPN